jgi:6-pyruvoyltetrahydropterin/6-carboxytetrahydropterin synthase
LKKTKISLFKSIRFTATHYYKLSQLSSAENTKRFGKVSLPHSHTFKVEVGVGGKFDKATGMVADLPELEMALAVLTKKLHKSVLNESVDFFKTNLPTTENLCLYFYEELNRRLKKSKVKCIRVYESDTIWSELTF